MLAALEQVMWVSGLGAVRNRRIPDPIPMKCLTIFSCGALLAANLWAAEPPQKIDISSVPATVVDNVIVPVPSEVFGVLEKLGTPNWREVLRSPQTSAPGDRAQTALLLGTVIAEGFVAVEAQESEEVKKIGRAVLKLSAAIGVQKSVIGRSNAIIEAAGEKDWNKVRGELDGALREVKDSMIELHDEQLAQLVSLGGWLRGTEALTQIVSKSYTKDGAELLHQPSLYEYFSRCVTAMSAKFANSPAFEKVKGRLPEIGPLINTHGDISPKAVEQVHAITEDLVKTVSSREL